MKQIWINEMYLYYTEVQIEKVNFWFISNDPFIVAGSEYCLYHCKEVTLAQAFTCFIEDIIQPKTERQKAVLSRRRKSGSDLLSVMPMVSGALMSGYVQKLYQSKLNEDKGEDNINAI